MPGRRGRALCRAACRLGPAGQQSPAVIAVAGDVAFPIGHAGKKPVGIVDEVGCGRRAAGTRKPFDLGYPRQAVDRRELVNRQLAKRVRHSAGIVRVVRDGIEAGRAGMLAGNGSPFLIIAPGRIALSGLVDDAGQARRERLVFIEILGPRIVILVQRRVVRIDNPLQQGLRLVFEVVDLAVSVDVLSARTVGNGFQHAVCVVCELQAVAMRIIRQRQVRIEAEMLECLLVAVLLDDACQASVLVESLDTVRLVGEPPCAAGADEPQHNVAAGHPVTADLVKDEDLAVGRMVVGPSAADEDKAPIEVVAPSRSHGPGDLALAVVVAGEGQRVRAAAAVVGHRFEFVAGRQGDRIARRRPRARIAQDLEFLLSATALAVA